MKQCFHRVTELTQTQRDEIPFYTHKSIRITEYYKCRQCGSKLFTRREQMDRLVPLEPVDA